MDETLVRIDEGQESGQQQQQQQTQKSAEPSLAEIEFQETLIAERESEIREIESGIHELNEIFRDLGHIVQEQGGMIGRLLIIFYGNNSHPRRQHRVQCFHDCHQHWFCGSGIGLCE